jgi:hypothetical protein
MVHAMQENRIRFIVRAKVRKKVGRAKLLLLLLAVRRKVCNFAAKIEARLMILRN